jgi:hypothetical protein
MSQTISNKIKVTNLLLQECQAAEPDKVLHISLPEFGLSADYYKYEPAAPGMPGSGT